MAVVSIIVPIFNSEKYLEMCVNSILGQKFTDIELILINDGSTDGSSEICAGFAEKDDRVNVFNIPNSGVSEARNIGIKYAKGKFILFVDSDDYIENDIIEVLYREITLSNSDIAMCGYRKFYDEAAKNINTQYHCRPFIGRIEIFVSEILYYFYPPIIQSPCWKLFRKELISINGVSFDINMSLGEDTDFVLKYLRTCQTIVCIDACLYNYRVHGSESLSTKFRTDKIGIYLSIAQRYLELEKAKLFNATNNYDVIICNSFISLMNELENIKNHISKKEFLSLSEKVIFTDVFLNSFKKISSVCLKYKVLAFLLSFRSISLITKYFELTNYLKKWRCR